MEELHNGLAKEAEFESKFKNLLDTAVQWATYVLRNNNGKALDHGLNIAKELANYHEEIEGEQ